MYLLKSNKADYAIQLPTSMNEITNKILAELTDNITLKEHYTLVALVYKTTLFNLASQVNGGLKADSINVIPIIAKESVVTVTKDKNHLPVKGHDGLIRPIIAPSAIERGYEVYIPTAASLNSVLGYIQHDNDLRIELFQKKYKGNVESLGVIATDNIVIEDNSQPIYLLGFKIVANNDIVATVPLKQSIKDTYILETCKEL